MERNSSIFNFSRLLFKLVLVGILVFGALEVRLRSFSSSPFITKGKKIVLPANKEYVFVNKSAKRLDPIIRVRRNSLGFRGAEPPDEWANALTVIVVGGSTAACDNLNEGKTWVDWLAKKLEQDFPTLWLNNAGFAGHSSVAHILMMEDYILRLKPNVVVFFVGINDIDVEEERRFDESIVRGRFQFHSLIDFLRSVNRNSEAVNVLVNLVQQKLKRKRAFAYNEMDFSTTPHLAITLEQQKAVLKGYREKNVKEFRERLETLVKLSREHGITPVFVTVPSLFGARVDPETDLDISDLRVGDKNVALMGAILDLYNDEIVALRKEGVTVIDSARTMPKSSHYFTDFHHFTNEGAERAAEEIYPGLKKALAAL